MNLTKTEASKDQERILRALRRGALYRPTLELILDLSEQRSRDAIEALLDAGLIEVATDIGPATYRLVDDGEA